MMFKEIITSKGRTIMVNLKLISTIELHPANYSWKILMLKNMAYDTQEFESKDAAMKWFNKTFE